MYGKTILQSYRTYNSQDRVTLTCGLRIINIITPPIITNSSHISESLEVMSR